MLRNLRRRRCGSIVGSDGRNLLRVKNRCVESSSLAPPRAKYLVLLMARVDVCLAAGMEGWCFVVSTKRQSSRAPTTQTTQTTATWRARTDEEEKAQQPQAHDERKRDA